MTRKDGCLFPIKNSYSISESIAREPDTLFWNAMKKPYRADPFADIKWVHDALGLDHGECFPSQGFLYVYPTRVSKGNAQMILLNLFHDYLGLAQNLIILFCSLTAGVKNPQ